VIGEFDDFLSSMALHRYYDYYFFKRDYDMQYQTANPDRSLFQMLSVNKEAVRTYRERNGAAPKLLRQSFFEANRYFEVIEKVRSVIVCYNEESRRIVSDLCAGCPADTYRSLLRKAQRYTVNTYRFNDLLRSGAIKEVSEGTGVYYLVDGHYDSCYGLRENSRMDAIIFRGNGMMNNIEYKLWGRRALFTDPVSKIGGEKYTYPIPTYQALKGITESIYWKPTIIWVIDSVRIMKPIRNESVNVKPLEYGGGNSLSIYTYLADVEYHVRAPFVWNENRSDLGKDRIDGKHYSQMKRAIEKGGRRDIFLGTRECQGYVEPCSFNEGVGAYDNTDSMAFGLMFHGFDYADEIGKNELNARFWMPEMKNGIIDFPSPEECRIRKHVRDYLPRKIHVSDLEAD
jgi:CRISPR-associated protein Cas5d